MIKPPYVERPPCEPGRKLMLRQVWLQGFLSGALCIAAVVVGVALGTVLALWLL